ncbi:hypothetical protein PHYSODRAFT_437005, partial [Phytophthora sojae]
MCCTAVFHKVDFDFCRICGGKHTMIERRLKCSSKTCIRFGKCGIVWKVFQCKGQDKWRVLVNLNGHARGVLTCSEQHTPLVTRPMKAFIATQDEVGLSPRVIEVHLKKQVNIRPSRGGWPTLSQVQNALKRIRKEQGPKNSIQAIHRL